MTHLKRQKIPKTWPVARKGKAFVVRPNSNIEKGIPLLILLRDVLKVAQNRKEVKGAMHAKNILVNNKTARDDKNNVLLFDTITIVPSKKYYRLGLKEKGKFDLKEIDEKETNYKVSKIVNKKILKGKKTQLNLSDGRNILSENKNEINDSVLINLKEKKIEKNLPLKEKANALVFGGKHAGTEGIIEKIDKKNKRVLLNVNDKKINVLIKQIMVVK